MRSNRTNSAKRRLRNATAVVSLALAVAFIALWAVSYWWTVGFAYQSPGATGLGMEATHGRILAGWGRDYTTPGLDFIAIRARGAPVSKGRFGFLYQSPRRIGGITEAAAPIWFFALWPPLAAWLLWKRAPAAGAHACPRCGYDLRATPDRCPECGTAVRSSPRHQTIITDQASNP